MSAPVPPPAECPGAVEGETVPFKPDHYFEVSDSGKMINMMTFDDTLSMFNAMKK